jgi:hypothetical protein
MSAIDFQMINQKAVAALPAILGRILPGGFYACDRHEYVVKNPRRADRRAGSFKIRVAGRRAGCWADFSTGDKGGDVVSLIAFIEGTSQREAATALARVLGIELSGATEVADA